MLIVVPTSKPLSLKATPISWSTIFVEWESIPDAKLNGNLRGYRIKYKKYSLLITKWNETVSHDITSKIFYVHNLAPDTNYLFRITGFTNAGDSPPAVAYTSTLEGGMNL